MTPHNKHGGAGRGQGRKPLTPTEPTVKVAITLLASQAEAMKQLGDGNLSAGIRKAIENMSTKLTEQQALQMAEEAIEYADTEGHLIGGTLFVGIDLVGKFWVTDNGEEVSGLTEQGAIDIIAENLLATKDE